MEIGLYIAIGFNSVLIIGLGILFTLEIKHYTKQIIKNLDQSIKDNLGKEIKEHMKANFVEVNPRKAHEFSNEAKKDMLKLIDKDIVKYSMSMNNEEKSNLDADWVFKRVRNIIFEKYKDIDVEQKELSKENV